MPHLVALLLSLVAIVQPPGSRPISMESAMRARRLTMAVMQYAQEHDNHLPPDLASLVGLLADANDGESPQAAHARVIRELFISPDDPTAPPADLTDDWVNNNASYAYLGFAGITQDDVPAWETTVVAHLKLDRGHASPPTPEQPEGGVVFVLAFMDGHVEVGPRDRAQALIEESTAIFASLRTGADLPDRLQAVADLRAIAAAVRAYAKAHDGVLPPDLGATFPHLRAPKSRKPITPAEQARTYLDPGAKRGTTVPQEPSPDWINRNTSYVYLGSADLKLGSIEAPETVVLLHGRLDRGIKRDAAGADELFPIATVRGDASTQGSGYTTWIVNQSRRVLDSARTGAPLPEYFHAYRDVRLLGEAIVRYAAANAGKLPPDLAAAFEFIPPEAAPDIPEAERARVLLSPNSEAGRGSVEGVTSEWIQRNASYVYLGSAQLTLAQARSSGLTFLVHGSLAEPYKILVPGGLEVSVIPVWNPYGHIMAYPAEVIERAIDEVKRAEANEAKGGVRAK